MKIPATALASIIVAASAVPAHAGWGDDEESDSASDSLLAQTRAHPDRVYGQLGFGSTTERELDEVHVDYMGLLFGLAVQRGKYTLIGEVQLGHQRDHDEKDSTLSSFATDVGVYVRRDAVSWVFGDRTMVARLATWVVAGVATELMWFDDEAMYRPKIALGIGGGLEVMKRSLGLGFTFDVRLEAAPAVRWDGGVAGRCAGSCEMTFANIDMSAMTVIAFPFSF